MLVRVYRRLVSMDLVEVNPALDVAPAGQMHGDDPSIKVGVKRHVRRHRTALALDMHVSVTPMNHRGAACAL